MAITLPKDDAEDNEVMRLFISHAPSAIAMFDCDMHYLAASQRWIEDYGLEGMNIIGQLHYEVFPEISETWKRVHSRGLQGEIITAHEDRFDRADGTSQWLNWEVRPWYRPSREIGGIVIFTEDITALKTAEHTLKHKIEKLEKLMDIVPAAVWIANDPKCEIIKGNALANLIFEASEDENVSATTAPEVRQIFASDGRRLSAEELPMQLAAATNREIRDVELKIKMPSGQPITILGNAVPLRDEKGFSIGSIAAFQNITERRAAEEKVLRITKLYKALSQINQAIIRVESEETLFRLVCRMAVDLGGMVLATIRQLNPETNLLESVESYGSGADYLKNITISASDAVPEGKGPAGTSFRESKFVIISHYQTNEMTEPWHHQAKRYGWGSSGTFPILRGGKPFASLGVYHSDEKAFDSEAIDLLDEIARDVSFALDSFDREKERLKARSDLLARERHFRAYFDYAMVGMAAASINNGTLLEVNEALCKMLGYSAAELIQMTWAEITHPEDIEKSADAVAKILRGEVANFELTKRYISKDGNIIHAHIASRGVPDETGTLSYLVTIIDDITEIKNHESQLEHLIHHDPLTGLPNRVLLNDRLEMAVSRANRSGQNIAVCFMDLDGFKSINDKFGHAAADTLLVEVGRRLSTIARSIDTVARLGGDEFILILNGISGEEECRHMLERVMGIIRSPFEIGGNEVQISTSIGVAVYPDHVTSGAAMLRHADQAMYIAKQKGRGRIHFFDAVNDHLAQVRSEGLSRIEMGLQNNELVLYYQPVINMRSGAVVGMEALIRWQHPERGLLTPGEFMPLVENSEFEMRLAEWVITQGMAQMEAWQRQGLSITVSVNLPARYLQSHGFVDFLVPLISPHTEVPSNAIRLEILETAALGDLGSAIKKMTECIKHGIQFSIDDFGTGYASLSYLRRLPADTIKIDQSFVQGMLEDMDDLSIVQGVIGLADAFQKRVVAEGVETVEHGTKLLAMGCKFGQGYGIARPMAAEHVVNWIKEFRLPREWNELSIGAGI